MARLRRVSPRSAGWTRRRVGRGFSYRDAGGEALPQEEVERIRSLAIPPAWEEVWICPHPNGHIQAVGTDAAGRRQYLYHPAWRAKRDELKFDRVKGAGTRLAKARERIIDDLAGEGMPLARAAATATRLLDLGYFRIGSDAYADANGSFGLTTLERRHVRRQGDDLVFGFVGKSGIEHSIVISDPHVIDVAGLHAPPARRVPAAARVQGGGPVGRPAGVRRQRVHRDDGGRGPHRQGLPDVARDGARGRRARRVAGARGDQGLPAHGRSRRRSRRWRPTSGNTPTIARQSYVDPRVIDQYEDGVTIAETLRRRYRDDAKRQAAIEKAVARLIDGA